MQDYLELASPTAITAQAAHARVSRQNRFIDSYLFGLNYLIDVIDDSMTERLYELSRVSPQLGQPVRAHRAARLVVHHEVDGVGRLGA